VDDDVVEGFAVQGQVHDVGVADLHVAEPQVLHHALAMGRLGTG